MGTLHNQIETSEYENDRSKNKHYVWLMCGKSCPCPERDSRGTKMEGRYSKSKKILTVTDENIGEEDVIKAVEKAGYRAERIS
jgi:copper chaperone CopZ